MKINGGIVIGAVLLLGYIASVWSNSAKAKQLHARQQRIREIERETENGEIPSQEQPSVEIVSGRRRLVWASSAMRDGFARAGAPAGWLDIKTDEGGSIYELIVRESDFFLDARNGSHYGYWQGDPDAWKNTVGVTISDTSEIPADVQSEGFARYVLMTYKTPQRALAHHDEKNWF